MSSDDSMSANGPRRSYINVVRKSMEKVGGSGIHFKWGVVYGILALVVGYILVSLLAAFVGMESTIMAFFDPSILETSVWIFYISHNVLFAVFGVGMGRSNGVHIGPLEILPAPLLFVVPPLILTIAGFMIARKTGVSSIRQAVYAGASVVFGYFILVFMGPGYVFNWSQLTDGYLTLSKLAVFTINAIMYPVIFGAFGGVIAFGSDPRRVGEELQQKLGRKFNITASSIIILLLLLPVFLGFLFVFIFGLNILWLDAWSFVPLLQDLYGSGNIALGELFSEYHQHRIFFPRVIMLALASLTGYNSTAEMYFSIFLIFISALLIFYLYKKDQNIETWEIDIWKPLVPFIPVPWLLFTFRQYQTLLWGWAFQIPLAVVGVIAAVFALDYSDGVNWEFVAALAAGVFSSFSFVFGLVVWPMGLVYLLLSRTRNLKMYLAWIGSASVVSVLYFSGLTLSNTRTPFLQGPLAPIKYFLVSVGSPITFHTIYAGAIGVFVITLGLAVFYLSFTQEKLDKNAKWLSLVAFSFGSSFILTIGRGAFGPEQALTSRYTSVTILAFIGLYLACLNLTRDNLDIQRVVRISLVVLIFTGIFTGYAGGINEGERFRLGIENRTDTLLCYENASDEELGQLDPFVSPSYIRENARFLEENHLNVFAEREGC